MKWMWFICGILIPAGVQASTARSVAYIHGDVAADGTAPSGTNAVPYDQMLLTDTGNTGCSQFKAMVESQGYTISQYYDADTTLNAAFLTPFDVVVFGLHQKLWSSAEKSALDEWIRAGGGILMYSDSAAGGYYGSVGIGNPTGQTAVNNILSAYGMQVTLDQGGGTRAYLPDANSPHPVIWDQPVFEGEGVSPIAIDPAGSATALIPFDNAHKISGSTLTPGTSGITIPHPEWAAIAHCPVGKGSIIAIFDRQPMWNNGPGSNINRKNNREILRRIVRYLARDYGNSPEWLDLSVAGLELTYRQWSGGSGTPGFDYTARNTRTGIQVETNLLDEAWHFDSNLVEHISSTTEAGGETERTVIRLIPDDQPGFARVAILAVTNNPPSPAVIAINCGGAAFTGTDGTVYQADSYFVGGHTDTFPGNAVSGTTDDLLYNYARSNFSAYNIPVANGSYTVKLRFAETYFSASGKRVFDMWLEDTQILNDLDIVATAPGKWVAYDRTFSATVTDGILSITAAASINNSLLNAIVIIPD